MSDSMMIGLGFLLVPLIMMLSLGIGYGLTVLSRRIKKRGLLLLFLFFAFHTWSGKVSPSAVLEENLSFILFLQMPVLIYMWVVQAFMSEAVENTKQVKMGLDIAYASIFGILIAMFPISPMAPFKLGSYHIYFIISGYLLVLVPFVAVSYGKYKVRRISWIMKHTPVMFDDDIENKIIKRYVKDTMSEREVAEIRKDTHNLLEDLAHAGHLEKAVGNGIYMYVKKKLYDTLVDETFKAIHSGSADKTTVINSYMKVGNLDFKHAESFMECLLGDEKLIVEVRGLIINASIKERVIRQSEYMMSRNEVVNHDTISKALNIDGYVVSHILASES